MVQSVKLRAIFAACCIGILFCAFLVFPGFQRISHVHAAPAYPVRVLPNVAYGPKPNEVMDECLPVGGSSLKPGIIMIHGGSWIGGDKSHYSQTCTEYASEGYVAVTINYRLAPKYQWPDQIGDAQLAVRYLRANASALNLNPGMICALGDSAGSELALLIDELQTIHSADVDTIYPGVSPAVQCVVDQFGPTDMAQLYNENPSVQQVMSDYLDYQIPPAPVYTDASPLDNIAAQTGPALIIQGTQDTTVFPDQSQELQQALLIHGFSPEYISYNGGHEYTGISPAEYASIRGQINDFLNAFEQPGSQPHPHNTK